MSRAYVVYILMFAAFGAGIWLIFTIGGAMRAPDDLAGDWEIAWESAPPPGSGDAVMHVAQSGRFFVVRFGDAKPMSLTLQQPWKGARTGRWLQMQLAGEVWKVEVSGDIPLHATRRIPQVRVALTGPTNHTGIARRRNVELTTSPPAPGVAHAR
jgi:hypothetical protein